MWDAIVVGAGIEGSSTAYALAKRGQKVLLLERFPLPHSRGSSHGATRVIRRAYDVPMYTPLMKDAYDLWHLLEKEAGKTLLVTTGLLAFGRPEVVNAYAGSLEQAGLPCERLDSAALKDRYANRIAVRQGQTGAFDPDGGVLLAEKCLAAYQAELVKLGGTIRDGEAVKDVVPSAGGGPVEVLMDKDRYSARRVVLCLGPWAGDFLRASTLVLDLPLTPQLIKVCYWRSKDGCDAFSAKQGFPVLSMTHDERPQHIMYASPALEYPGLMKLCLHAGPVVRAEERDVGDTAEAMALLKAFVRRNFPRLEPEPAIVESCIYTVSLQSFHLSSVSISQNFPDGDFILDRHPRHSNVVVGAGFSGHGFKLAPVVGEALADLAVGREPKHDLRPFRMDRFGTTKGLPALAKL